MTTATVPANSKSIESWQEQANGALKEIDELRGKLPADKTAIWPDAESRQRWEKANADYDQAHNAINELRQGESVRRRLAELDEQRRADRDSGQRKPPADIDRDDSRQQPPNMADARTAFGAWAKRQYGGELTAREKETCRRLKFNPNARQLRFRGFDTPTLRELQDAGNAVHHSRRAMVDARGIESRAMSSLTATAGAEFVARGLVPQFEQAMLDYSGILQACEIFRTDNGEPIDFPTLNDTGNKGAQLNENAQAASNVDPATAEVQFNAYNFTSKIVLVSTALIEDDSAGFVGRLPSIFGERIGRILNEKCTTGSGTDTPNGVVTAAAVGVTAASQTAITADEIISLEHAVDFAYRQGPRVGYMLHDSIMKAIRLLKDGENRYLWVSGLRDGLPDRLNGYQLWRNADMASSMVADAKVLLFGDFSKYKVRQVRDIRFYRLQERYRDYDQDGFVAFLRADGDEVDAGVAPIKVLKMAAA